MNVSAGIIKKAIQIAKKSEFFPYQVGAVVFKGNRILATGFNGLRSCTRVNSHYKRFEHTLHAEQDAISKLRHSNKIKGASILVIRVNHSGNISLGKPCEYCQKMIEDFGIKTVYYSNRSGEISKEKVQWSNSVRTQAA